MSFFWGFCLIVTRVNEDPMPRRERDVCATLTTPGARYESCQMWERLFFFLVNVTRVNGGLVPHLRIYPRHFKTFCSRCECVAHTHVTWNIPHIHVTHSQNVVTHSHLAQMWMCGMFHVTCVNVSCQTSGWVMAHTCERVMAHTCERVMSNMRMSHVTHVNQSRL